MKQYQVKALGDATMVGRNGFWSITAIEVRELFGTFVSIDGIGQRGRVLNGGFTLSFQMMDELASKWSECRGHSDRKEQADGGSV